MAEGIFPNVLADALPWITVDQMRDVDRIMIEELHIDLPRMMEGAGRTLAQVAERLFAPRRVTVLAGAGGNGGGALVAARHLSNHGIEVDVVLDREPDELSSVTRRQWDILDRMGQTPAAEVGATDLLVDGLIGYGLEGRPRGRTATLIEMANALPVPTLSLDTPSGLDPDSDVAPHLAVEASATMTLAAPKVGLRTARTVGTLLLSDISVPPFVFERVGVGSGPVFRDGSILHVTHRSTPRPIE